MATFTSNAAIILCLMAVMGSVCVPISLATDYTVGESAGWSLGTDYDSWASGKTFSVGDTLSKYTHIHSVLEQDGNLHAKLALAV